MFVVNKKMWSFNFGCILSASFVWIMALGMNFPVLNVLNLSPEYIQYYYANTVVAIASTLFTVLLLVVMKKGFNISTRDHVFWLLLPTAVFVIMAVLTGVELYSSLLSAALPSSAVVILAYLFSASAQKSPLAA